MRLNLRQCFLSKEGVGGVKMLRKLQDFDLTLVNGGTDSENYET
jgi:hypothetical protein